MARAGSVGVLVAAGFGCERHQMHMAMANAAQRHQLLRAFPHRAYRPAQDHGFQAVIVVQMGVHAAHHQVMVFVLEILHPAAYGVFVMIVDVAHVGNAKLGAFGVHCRAAQPLAQQVAHRLRPIDIAARRDQPIEPSGQFVIQRNGEALRVGVKSGYRKPNRKAKPVAAITAPHPRTATRPQGQRISSPTAMPPRCSRPVAITKPIA